MSGTPMSNEQRAALERRLAELRASQQAAGAGTGARGVTQSSNGNSNGTGTNAAYNAARAPQSYATQDGRPAPQMSYGYDDEDDDEEEEEEFDLGRQQFEEEFLRMLVSEQLSHQQQHQQWQAPQQQHERNAASVAQVSATRHADEGVDVVATDKTAQRSREVGDFEALRLAKMGDMASLLDFGTACGVNWRTFTDNRGRNALHYATDAGAAALIRKLAGDLRVPYVADEKQLTPLDVAVLNGHTDVETDEVVAALFEAATAARHADAQLLADPAHVKTLESVLQAHAPAPPRFVMSKPVPKPPEGGVLRTFWSANAAAPSCAASAQCSSGVDMSADEAAAVTAAVNALDKHGRFEWLLPVARGSQAPCERWEIARSVSDGSGSDGTTSTLTAGIVVAQVLANAVLKGSAAEKIKMAADTPTKVVMAAHLGVKGAACHAGVAASLLQALRTRIREEAAEAAPNSIVFFAAGAQLPRPPAPLATVKWYRRVFAAVDVFASDSAYDVFPDFYNYDAVLRADAVLKGAISEALYAKYATELPAWCMVDPASEEQCALVQHFMAAKAGTAESNVDLACVPQDVAELRRSVLSHPDHHAYVRTNEQQAVTDLVVFRRRDARHHADTGTFAAEVVYALFTSIAGPAKADHMMLLASRLLSAKMLLVPTLFGITESDLARSNFDELTSCREFVYAVSPTTLKEVEGLGAVPAAKLSLPLYSI